MKAFFIVCKDEPELYASKRHESLIDALIEADRLTKKEKCRFFVMVSFKVVHPILPAITSYVETCKL